jgi:hypothetical protein
MTSGKKPDSAMPRKNLNAKRPPKFCTQAANRVIDPKVNIRMGRTLAGPYFLPMIAVGGAKMTYGTKKIDTRRLYCPGLKLRSEGRIRSRCIDGRECFYHH